MHQNYDSGAIRPSLYPEIDRIQMSSADRARAKAYMLRAEHLAELLIGSANRVKAAAEWVNRTVPNWISKSRTTADNQLTRRLT